MLSHLFQVPLSVHPEPCLCFLYQAPVPSKDGQMPPSILFFLFCQVPSRYCRTSRSMIIDLPMVCQKPPRLQSESLHGKCLRVHARQGRPARLGKRPKCGQTKPGAYAGIVLIRCRSETVLHGQDRGIVSSRTVTAGPHSNVCQSFVHAPPRAQELKSSRQRSTLQGLNPKFAHSVIFVFPWHNQDGSSCASHPSHTYRQ